MSGFDAIIGQHLPLRLLQTFVRNGAVPHALLFAGMPGIGKRTSARTFAAALNCRNRFQPAVNELPAPLPCGECRSCGQIQNGRHPDIIHVEPQGNLLRIDQIRQLRSVLAMRPFSAHQRVVLISDSQCMNPEAANALLKVLEEPPQDTILILTAHQQSDLLPTIVSRCRYIPFAPLEATDIRSYLIDMKHVDPEEARTLAHICQGSLGKALELVKGTWRQERDWVIRASGLDAPEGLRRRPINTALAFAVQLAGRKDRVPDLLAALKTWIRDVSIWTHRPGMAVNQDLADMLEKACRQVNPARLLYWWKSVEKAQKDIAGNANLRLTLDLMAVRLASEPPSER